MTSENKIILYTTDDGNVTVSVWFEDDTFWLTQKAIAELFDVQVPAVAKHLKNIYDEEELLPTATISKKEIVQTEGNRQVTRSLEYYSLDAIIAVGYRVNSKKATRFRQWATKTLREYIQKGFVLNDELLKNGKPFGKDYFDETLMSMADWLKETDNFLTTNRRNVLQNKGAISHDDAVKRAEDIYAQFRVKQDKSYISEFDREMAKYLTGNGGDAE